MGTDKLLLDVGGTFIKCSDGRSVPVDSNASRDEIVAALRSAARTGASHLSVAVPGPFDYSSGRFLMKHKYAAVYGEYFADIVGLPRENCRFVHDVNCMLLGELREDEGCNTALIALGTGLGFAMSVDGVILKNELGSPAVSIFNKPYKDGMLEDYASKRGVLRLYGRDDITVKEVAERAFGGEQKAIDAFRESGTIIGATIAPILEQYKVSRLLLGGQISRSWTLFAPALVGELEKAGLNVQTGPISDFDNATFRGLEKL